MQHPIKPLSACIDTYTNAVALGDIAQAYRGILSALAQFKSAGETAHPQDTVGSLYQGYMDMSLWRLFPASFAEKRLKISFVFLHDSGTLTLWLSRRQSRDSKKAFRRHTCRSVGSYSLSVLEPGVDSIIAA